MVIIFLSLSIVASKAISAPLALVSLSVIKLSTLESVTAVSSVFLIASLKVRVILVVEETPVEESVGLNVIVGAHESDVVKFNEVASLIPA